MGSLELIAEIDFSSTFLKTRGEGDKMIRNILKDVIPFVFVFFLTVISPLPLYTTTTSGEIIRASLFGEKRR
jgi:hypothetical protein